MKFDGLIRSVKTEDLRHIETIIKPWLSAEEVSGYLKTIRDIVQSATPSQFNNHFFVAIIDNTVIGITAFRIPLPILLPHSSTDNPAELNMLYVLDSYHGMGVGSALINTIIDRTKKLKYTELIVRSAIRFKDVGWKFYDQFDGLHRVGLLYPSNPKKLSQIWAIKYQ